MVWSEADFGRNSLRGRVGDGGWGFLADFGVSFTGGKDRGSGKCKKYDGEDEDG